MRTKALDTAAETSSRALLAVFIALVQMMSGQFEGVPWSDG